MLRIIRLLRVVRVTRSVHALIVFRELRIIVYSLCGAFTSLLWSIFIMLIIILMFGVFFTEGVRIYADESEPTSEVQIYFGSLIKTMASLYMAVSGGLDWEIVSKTLVSLPMHYTCVLYFYICFTLFALMNVLTAVFVERVMERSQEDRDFVIQTEMGAKAAFMQTFARLFDDLDSDGSGKIKIEELFEHMQEGAARSKGKGRPPVAGQPALSKKLLGSPPLAGQPAAKGRGLSTVMSLRLAA
jgi:membrane protein implicated in regulation of membrane protease activity